MCCRPTTRLIITLTLALLLGSAAGAAPGGEVQIYTWVDAEGVTHFSESAPPGDTPYRRLSLPATSATASAEPAGSDTDSIELLELQARVLTLENELEARKQAAQRAQAEPASIELVTPPPEERYIVFTRPWRPHPRLPGPACQAPDCRPPHRAAPRPGPVNGLRLPQAPRPGSGLP